MFAIAIRMIKDKYKSLLIYCLSALAFLEMYIALFPTVKEQSATFEQIMKTMPPELFKVMNMDASSFSFSTMESYLSTEYMSFLWPILAIVFAISLASYIAIREVDKGTIEILCSLPISRTKIFISRYIAGIKMLAVFCIVSLLGAIPFAMLHNSDYKIGNYVTATIGAFLFVWAVYSLATLVSMICSEKGKATMITSGVLLLMYVLNIIANLNTSLANIKYLSFFHYFNGPELLNKNSLATYAIFVLGGFAVVATVVAAVRFARRDLSV